MAKDKDTTTIEGATPHELDESLWQAIGAFVKKCGGDVAKVTSEEREEFEEALAAWAVLCLDEGDE